MRNNFKILLFLLTCLFGFITELNAQRVINLRRPETDKDILLANEYFSQNEYEKAVTLYEQIVKEEEKISKVHKNYFTCLIKLKEYKAANRYFKRLLRIETYHPQYNVDYGILLKEEGKESDMALHYNQFLDAIRQDDNRLKSAAIYFMDARLFEYAEKAYQFGQKNRRAHFGFDLAELYFNWGKTEEMVKAYFDLLENTNTDFDNGEISAVQNFLQDKLDDEEEFDSLEPIIFQYIQKKPGKLVYNEMLVWFYLQKKEFHKAFLQAKAIDKRKDAGGTEILQIGQLAYNNEEFETSVKIFSYLVDKYSKASIYGIAKNRLIEAKEQVVRRTYPIDLAQIKSLVKDYEESVAEFGIRSNTTDAVRNMAKLQAFYLNNKDTAISILEKFINGGYRVRQKAIDEAKLDLGDIYLLRGEPWESTLIYAQVEKSEKDKNLGHQAKLKNAKLSYYKGDFQLAKGHLDVLKLATSREIANDAMELSLLIQDNLELDTSELAMREFAAIDLLMFQNQYQQALIGYDSMLVQFPQHSLTDEILWRQANILNKLGKVTEAVAKLEAIMKDYPVDILGDDATFLAGTIYEEQLGNKEKAKELYLKLLTDYSGSVYVAEARKRARLIRGDKL